MPKKYTSKEGVKFWAERNDFSEVGGGVSWIVISQVDGFPATEAYDDWFGRQKDADEVARMLADGVEV